MSEVRTIFVSSVLLLQFFGCFCDFSMNYLGNYVSDEEYNNRTLCWTDLCMEDSDRLINAADHDSNKTEPCINFKAFATGEFFKHRVPSNRYRAVGFNLDIVYTHWKRQKKMLLKPITQSDPKMFKVMKSFFRRCIDTRETYCVLVKHKV